MGTTSSLYSIPDNNGDFSCGPCANTGIAPGHMRLANIAQWNSVPVGAIILIYNDAETDPILPTADPDDTAPHDSVYVIPSSDASIEYSTTACTVTPTPLGACGTCGGMATYAGACYAATNAWLNVNLRNTGDAAQVRMPDGSYFHGFAYGTAANNMAGGLDGLLNPISGGNLSFFFANSSSDDFRLAANWSSVTSLSATPGSPNNAENQAWIDFIRTDCPLPVEYAEPLRGEPTPAGNVLRWATGSERGSSHFVVRRSLSATEGFEEIGRRTAAGNTSELRHYDFTDVAPPAHAYYVLDQVDHDGKHFRSHMIEIYASIANTTRLHHWPQPASDHISFEAVGVGAKSISLYNGLGRHMLQVTQNGEETQWEGSLDLSALETGLYFLALKCGGNITYNKVAIGF
jgi:hypothetical protein